MKITLEIECEDRDALRAVLAHLADAIELDEFPLDEPMDDYQCFGQDIGEARVDFWPHWLTVEGTAKPTIASIARECANGDCTLFATFTDGCEKKLFSYYVDELCFVNSDLIGLTEDEAHQLRQQRDVAYLRS